MRFLADTVSMEKLKNMKTQVLSNNWGTLTKVSYDYQNHDLSWSTQTREVYNRGDGATILLYNTQTNKIILTEQFRVPTYLNQNADGILIETCAGKVENEDPYDCVLREALEETGVEIPSATKVFEAYMSPASVTELIHFFIAPYDESMKRNSGGGLASEQENITVLELDFREVVELVRTNKIKDGKTLMLIQHVIINQILRH